jgi:hypothetical protein
MLSPWYFISIWAGSGKVLQQQICVLLRNYLWAGKEQEAKCRVKVEGLLCEEKG